MMVPSFCGKVVNSCVIFSKVLLGFLEGSKRLDERTGKTGESLLAKDWKIVNYLSRSLQSGTSRGRGRCHERRPSNLKEDSGLITLPCRQARRTSHDGRKTGGVCGR